MRRPVLLLAVLLAAPGCGGDEPAPTPKRPVQLTVAAPADEEVVDDDAVQVAGRVSPAASDVRVLGRTVDVTGGAFATSVELEEGANVIDVTAAAPGRRAASTAVRVVRRVPVEVPDVEGEQQDAAIGRLEALGLEVELTEGGGLLDGLLPGEVGVCSTDPEPGTEVRPGTTVVVEVARVC